MSLRDRNLYWGATAEEIERVMPGDAAIPDPTYDTTLAVTVDASAGDIWPWLIMTRRMLLGLKPRAEGLAAARRAAARRAA